MFCKGVNVTANKVFSKSFLMFCFFRSRTPDLEDSDNSSIEELHDLGKQLEHNLAALF